MAYFNMLASVCNDELKQLRKDPTYEVHPSLVSGASHLLAYWVVEQPLGELLARALDGGVAVHPDLWQPLRPPCFHPPESVRQLADGIQEAISAVSLHDDDWLATEVNRLLRLFRHAGAGNECVISALERPGDAVRAKLVRTLWR